MFAIIAASGNGTRFGEKKQFLKIAGKYILRLIAQKLISCQVENIVIATQLEDLAKCKKILKGLEKHICFSQGGVTRQETVKKAFLKFYENYDKTDIVLIHDAARPFFDINLTKTLIKTAKETKAAILAQPINDTVKKTNSLLVKTTLNRNQLFLAQTPQAFEINLFKQAILNNEKNEKFCTDDSQLVENLKFDVKIIPSFKTNFKITTKEDLKFAEFLILNEKY